MIEECNFKYTLVDEYPDRCYLTPGKKCPGEMNCILYVLYYNDEIE
jgi:hypothetical protein